MTTPHALIQKPLQGEERPMIDSKNRITISSGWREIIGGNEIHVMPSIDGKCLKMLPPAEMDRLRAFINTLPGPKRTAAQRKIGYDSRCIRWDGQGRCVLPDEFCKRLNLCGEVVISGVDQILEVWNLDNWKLMRADNDRTAAEPLSEYGL